MKKVYINPITECIVVYERYGVLENENSGIASGGSSLGKENTLNWDEEGSFDLWESDEDDDNLWNNE